MIMKQLFNKLKIKGNGGFGLDSLIGFLVLFGIAIVVVVILVILNRFI